MIVVLADDLTGAAEVAGIALVSGLTAEVHIDRLLPSNSDVVVIDADSRSCSDREATEKMRHIAIQVRDAAPQWVFTKVDSLLRGPVHAALQAINEVFQCERILMVNANPRKGRVVQGGELTIEGQPIDQTCFANDPEHPREGSGIDRLLGVPPQPVASVQFDRSLPRNGFLVGDAASECELLSWARLVFGMRGEQYEENRLEPKTLLVGAAEFFQALLTVRGFRFGAAVRNADVPLMIEPDSLLISGSRVGSLTELPIPKTPVAIDDQDVVARIRQQLQEEGRSVLHCLPELAADADRCAASIVSVASDVIRTHNPHHVWIEGGRTACRLVRACGWERLVAKQVHGDGVVRMGVAGASVPDLVLKPGSYPWPPIRLFNFLVPPNQSVDEAVA